MNWFYAPFPSELPSHSLSIASVVDDFLAEMDVKISAESAC